MAESGDSAAWFIDWTEARERVSQTLGVIRGKLASHTSLRADIRHALETTGEHELLAIELLLDGMAEGALDLLVMRSSQRGNPAAIPIAYMRYPAARKTVASGKLDLSDIALGDPLLTELRPYQGRSCMWRRKQLESWLADLVVQQRMAAALSRPTSAPDVVMVVGADGAITITTPQDDPQASVTVSANAAPAAASLTASPMVEPSSQPPAPEPPRLPSGEFRPEDGFTPSGLNSPKGVRKDKYRAIAVLLLSMQPGGNVPWGRFCDEVRKLCRQTTGKPPLRGFGNEQIKKDVRNISSCQLPVT
jgi:hypothetical protein